ncbi:hypothetical protein C1H46_025694 [Malus baccata]|uniref:tRNA 4-demethylwyosine synthase (AdoMet-dependent) n=1 Tax=Malus baccata TaxID=106549 RepID=A0A540LQR6_MALBA|nr:hypothetical protein C1H46_025694 [Malus baccata]
MAVAVARLARLGRKAKLPGGFCIKMAAAAILGLCFIFAWSMFSSPSSSVTTRIESFDNIVAPPGSRSTRASTPDGTQQAASNGGEEKRATGSAVRSPVHEHKSEKKEKKVVNGKKGKGKKKLPESVTKVKNVTEESESEDSENEKEDGDEEKEVVDGKEEALSDEGEGNGEAGGEGDNLMETADQDSEEVKLDDDGGESEKKGKKRYKMKGPLFDPKAHYSWKQCSTRSKHNYIPCIDMEVVSGRLQYRHTERSCPKAEPMCLVPLPRDGYGLPVPWPESKEKILYKNVEHPKLAAFVKEHSWVMESGEYLTFPQNQSELKGGILHYLESIEEMVPDIEWGKNIRVVLDIGCTDSAFGASLVDKDVLTLALGLKDDLVDLAQVALERGLPAFVSPFRNRRLPFPSSVFDAVHCGGCTIPWHSNGGKHLLEMNRILRPGGYFVLSTKHDSFEDEEAMTKLTASICWNILAHKTDEVSDVGVKIYQKPDSNDIYELRRKKYPPLCKENENPDAAWYVPVKTCLHPIPSAIEQHGTEWPDEWPQRLERYPDWLSDKVNLDADTKHWKAIVDRSYLTGLGIDWSKIRNVMDMKAIYGGFAAALTQQKVWVMNVVPVHAPDTLPFIFERGLVGTYHDWCESFGTYPRSYDLLHVDHLFSRLKNRCKQPVSIVVEMDRLLRPGGWAIIREKVEVLEPLEGILKTESFDGSEEDEDEEDGGESGVVDLEDIAGKGPSRRNPVAVTKTNGTVNGKKEMVTPVIRASLTKQGYKIIGSHSGVKICRWTKSQLRGRGGCYKHSFYGIESHRCMETTPSLACANKCVFCWRHHTNPVGKSWQWKMDDPLEIVNSAIDQHTKMIKQMKGVPGVTLERLTEGLSPRHCALSLVGEPIMYPEINALVDELHRRRISTFLVTNAQFPEKIKMLNPITQLYVSVDAATKESLKAIDRPLFGDFWERFIDSLTSLKDKQQRTVYRLTLVKGWNTEDIDAYYNIFSLGSPDFVEIKGVTYCGTSATSKLTMENVPWHADVKAFSEALALKSNGEYEVACEHVHSCCVLLAKTSKFKINGQWFTWIDYEKFHDLVASGKPFDSKDYMAPTPSWAVYGADEGGFDPYQSRYKKERHHRPNQ